MRICAATWPWVSPSSLRRARIMLAKSSVNRPSPGHPAVCVGSTTSPSSSYPLSKRRRSNHAPLTRPRTAAEVRRVFAASPPRRHRLPKPSQREPRPLHAQPRQVHLHRHRLHSPLFAPLRRPLHRLSPTDEVYRTNGQHLYSETMVIVKPSAEKNSGAYARGSPPRSSAALTSLSFKVQNGARNRAPKVRSKCPRAASARSRSPRRSARIANATRALSPAAPFAHNT